MDFTRARRNHNVIRTYLSHSAVLNSMKQRTEVILEFYKSNINSLSKKRKG